jgi:hypothetical protein
MPRPKIVTRSKTTALAALITELTECVDYEESTKAPERNALAKALEALGSIGERAYTSPHAKTLTPAKVKPKAKTTAARKPAPVRTKRVRKAA